MAMSNEDRRLIESMTPEEQEDLADRIGTATERLQKTLDGIECSERGPRHNKLLSDMDQLQARCRDLSPEQRAELSAEVGFDVDEWLQQGN